MHFLLIRLECRQLNEKRNTLQLLDSYLKIKLTLHSCCCLVVTFVELFSNCMSHMLERRMGTWNQTVKSKDSRWVMHAYEQKKKAHFAKLLNNNNNNKLCKKVKSLDVHNTCMRVSIQMQATAHTCIEAEILITKYLPNSFFFLFNIRKLFKIKEKSFSEFFFQKFLFL